MPKKIHCLNNCQTTPCTERSVLNLTLLCNSDNADHHFRIPSRMKVSDFLELALAKLSKGKGAERVEALKQSYEPILEVHREDGTELALPSHLPLSQTAICDGDTVRIAAHPLKKQIMFCRYG